MGDRDTFNMFTPPDRGRFGDNESTITGNDSVKSDLIDLTLVLHWNRPASIKVSKDALDQNAVFLPKSKIEFIATNKYIRGTNNRGHSENFPYVSVTLPQWLAKEKGLI